MKLSFLVWQVEAAATAITLEHLISGFSIDAGISFRNNQESSQRQQYRYIKDSRSTCNARSR